MTDHRETPLTASPPRPHTPMELALRQFIDGAPLAIAMFDTDMRYLAASRGWRADYGLGNAPLVGQRQYDLFPEMSDDWKAVHRRCLAGAIETRDGDEFVRADGRHQRVRWEVQPWRSEDGAIGGLMIFAEDLTRASAATLALEKARDEQHVQADAMRLILETSAQGILSVDTEGVIVTANSALERMFGWASGELIGQSLDCLIPADVRTVHASHHRTFWTTPGARPMGQGLELRGLRKDGSVFPLEVSLNHADTPLGRRAVAFVSDITERVRAAGEQREAAARLRLAMDAAEAGAWSLDAGTNLVEADAAICGRLGVAPGLPFPLERLLASIHPKDRDIVRAAIDSVCGSTGTDGFSVEYRVPLPDGRVAWLHGIGRAHEMDGARRVVGITQDVTARKEAQVALDEAHRELISRAAELERRTLQLGQLASDLTLAEQHAREQLAKSLHDHLQQLLFSTRLRLDRLSTRLGDDGPQAALLGSTRQELDEAIAAARSLAVELSPPLLYDSGLPAALGWLAKWTQEKYGLVVELTVDPRANPARRDVRTLVFESVRELLFNAVKHAKVDSVEVALALVEGPGLQITVADHGQGFDAAALMGAGLARQVGLGLFSIRERLALLGGHLDVQSAPGDGARFILEAPLSGSRRADMSANAIGAAMPDGAWLLAGTAGDPPGLAPAANLSNPRDPGNRPLTILIADDHALVHERLRELFADRAEFAVVGSASNGLEAIAHARALSPDVIIMDVSMPDLNGIEATRRIRDELPAIQIFGLSSEERSNGPHPIEEAGAAGYFSKGDDIAHLVAHLLALHAKGER